MEKSNGRITFASLNSYNVLSEGIEYISVLSGKFSLKNGSLPAVGDYVEFYPNSSGNSIIEGILPRDSVISRRSAGREFRENVLAANIDYMLIVNAFDSTFSQRRIERFMVLAKSGGVTPVIILSKADMCDPLDMAVYTTQAEESAGGALIIEISSMTGGGIDEVEGLLKDGVTACAVGLSGAGKSTLLNRLMGEDLQNTAQVRAYDSKGKHCTTSRQMFILSSGAMFIDTPGIREVGLKGDLEAVEDVFSDIATLAEDCFFADCTHTHEPSCAVIEAVVAGVIDSGRYDNYLKLKKESENYKLRTEAPQEKKRSEKRLSRLVKSENKRKKKF